MKKNLLTIAVIASAITAIAQPAAEWSTIQNSNFSIPSAGVRHMDAVNDSVVWATGYDGATPGLNYNFFTVSSNGGNTFTSGNIYADTNTYVIANICGVDAQTAWVSSYLKSTSAQGAIHKTTNGGLNWTDMTAVGMYTNATAFTNIVAFFTPSVGITMGDPVAGEFEIWSTVDAGSTWTKIPGSAIPNPLTGEYGLVNVYTTVGNTIWFGTNMGRIYKSIDSGLNWTVASVPGASQGVNDIAFVDQNNGLCYAYSGTTASPIFGIYKTIDGGATWTAITPLDPNIGKNDICAIPGSPLFASCGAGTGNNIISYTLDQGTTWTDWGSVAVQYLALDFVSPTVGWAGSFSDPANAAVGGMYKFSGAPTGLSAIANGTPKALVVYPNPANDKITLNLPVAKEGLTISVIDVMGKVIMNEKVITTSLNEKYVLNLSNFSKGLYSVIVTKNGEKFMQKVIVE